ncbi:MAG: class I SAM-dependent methyltransferase, partial [bacterium]|nr:class I SAM-dependent methyltransferase [bacterium]
LKPFVQPGMKVLEPGCGFGYFSLPLAQLVGSEGRVVCVDVEPRAITRLQRRAHKAGLADRIEVHACEPRDLGLADSEGRFDLVTVIHVLHESDDVPGFLAQAVRMLKPDGRMLVVEPKGHVKPEQFEAEMKFCRAAGLRQLDLPEGKRRNPTALLALKSEG